MTNARIMADNIAAGIKANFNKTLGKEEKDALLTACRKVMKELHGQKTKKYIASEAGKGNGFCNFEDNSLGYDYSVFKEAAECLSYMKDDKKTNLMYQNNMALAEYYA